MRSVPETQNAALEDIDALFETNPTWLIGPGSRKKLAQIVANRKAAESVDPITGERRDRSSEMSDSGEKAKIETIEQVSVR